MTDATILMCIALSFAQVITACLAWDFGRRWIEDRVASRAPLQVLAELERKIEEGVLARKMLAEDWMRRFGKLEADWKKLKEHADSQFSGAIAQASSLSRGFR